MIITEIKNNPQCLTLADNSTLRLNPRESKEVDDYLMSSELKIAEEMNLIVIDESEEVEENTTEKRGRKKKGEVENG